MADGVVVLEDPDAVQALTHPVRLAVLEALREPDSAAGVARRIGQSRQAVNYHVKELERAGLVRSAGERRKGNFVEQLMEAVGGTFVVGARVAWSEERRAALRSQLALDQLVAVGERLQRDAGALLDRAVLDGEEVPSASVVADVRFADQQARDAFLAEYVTLVRDLARRHGAGRKRGDAFRVVAAVYPNPPGGAQ
jgi:DNA-binding transcriptional ArsR family regulator